LSSARPSLLIGALAPIPGMRPVPIVSVQPDRQLPGSLSRVIVGLCAGPFAQAGLDEALGLAVVFRYVGLGADVLEPEPSAD
jgi:hypothetical protein